MKEPRESKLLRLWKIRQEKEGHDVSGVTTLEEAKHFFDKKEVHLDASQFEEWSYGDLRKLAKDMGISAKGAKEELIERICGADVDIEDDATLEDDQEDAEKPTEEEVE